MYTRRSFAMAAIAALVLLTPLLMGCGVTPTPTAVPTQPPPTKPAATTAPTQVPPTAAPTKPPATATAVPPTPTAGPATGGKLVYALNFEPDTLDVQKTNSGAMHAVMSLVGAPLVTRDPADGKYVGYLADSWTFSGDGLTWTFKIRQGVKFHDGTPMTAQDVAWTFNRAIDPATKSVVTGYMLSTLKSAEATDAQTLVLNLKSPYYYLLSSLSASSYSQPLPKAGVEKAGDKWARAPYGVGPYKFLEWQTGSRITIQRNPDYKWRPAWNKGSGPYIDTIEFRIIPEASTIQAGLESGDIDFAGIQQKDAARTKATGKVNLFTTPIPGNQLYVHLNNSVAPLTDPAVRKALSYAINRAPIIQAVFNGEAAEQYAPISPSVAGYDKVQETYGYRFDVAKAKATLADAGYTAGAAGIMQKGGQPLKFKLNTLAGNEQYVKLAQILKEQWKAIGVDAEIQQLETATAISDLTTGKSVATTMGYGYSTADILFLLFADTKIGGGGAFFVTDPKLDELMKAIRTTLDAAKQQEAVNALVKYIMENAMMISIAAPLSYYGMSSRVKGFGISQVTTESMWLDAYITK